MTYITLGYIVGTVTVGLGLASGKAIVTVFGVALLFVSIYEAGKKHDK